MNPSPFLNPYMWDWGWLAFWSLMFGGITVITWALNVRNNRKGK